MSSVRNQQGWAGPVTSAASRGPSVPSRSGSPPGAALGYRAAAPSGQEEQPRDDERDTSKARSTTGPHAISDGLAGAPLIPNATIGVIHRTSREVPSLGPKGTCSATEPTKAMSTIAIMKRAANLVPPRAAAIPRRWPPPPDTRP